jgi:hypothetical protein
MAAPGSSIMKTISAKGGMAQEDAVDTNAKVAVAVSELAKQVSHA